MNKVFKVIWNHATQSWVAVSELTSAKGKTKSKTAAKLTALSAVVAGSTVIGGNALAATSVADGSGVVSISLATVTGAATATGTSSIAMGDNASAAGARGIAIGNGSNVALTSITNGVAVTDAIAIGTNATTSAQNAIAIGHGAQVLQTGLNATNGTGAVAIGANSSASYRTSVALGFNTTANWADAVAIGANAVANRAPTTSSSGVVTGQSEASTAVGTSSNATGNGATALGSSALANNTRSVALGREAKATGERSIALGSYANATNGYSIAIGSDQGSATNSAQSYAIGGIAIGAGSRALNNATGDAFSAFGGQYGVAIGIATTTQAMATTAIGYNANALASYGTAIGAQACVSTGAVSAAAIGPGSRVTISQGVALGLRSWATLDAATTLIAAATTDEAKFNLNGFDMSNATFGVTKRINNYDTLTSNDDSVRNSTRAGVSVGRTAADGSRETRQIHNLAAGSRDSDAVNVAQLKSVNLKIAGNTVAGATYDNVSNATGADVRLYDQTLTVNSTNTTLLTTDATNNTINITVKNQTIPTTVSTTTNGTGAGSIDVNATTDGVATTKNVAEAINAAYWKVGDNTQTVKHNVSAGHQVNFVNGTATISEVTAEANNVSNVTFNVNYGDGLKIDDGKLVVNTTTLSNNANGSVVTPVANASNLVNASQVAAAINNSGWNTTTTAGANVTINPGDAVNYVNGNGTTANVTTTTVNGKDVVSVSYDVNRTTGTVNPNGTVSVTDGNSFLNASTVANLVNNAAFNVTTAKNDVFVTNQEGKANVSVKAGGNITYTAGKNIAIKQDGSNFTFATEQNVTFTNANVTSTLAIGNASSTSSPVVNLKTENATTASVNNNTTTAPSSALNITSADGKATQIKGVASSLNTTTVNTYPAGNPAGTTTATTKQLLDLGTDSNPLSESVLNSVVTVRDLTNLGWVVSANGNNYTDTVKNANEVKFNGVNGITVTGNTTDGVRNINISLNTTNITSNANGTTSVTNGDSYVNASTVSNAINNAGWNTTTTAGANVTINPGDAVNYVNGNGTTANVTTTTVNGKDVVSVSYDVNTGSITAADSNATITITNADGSTSTIDNPDRGKVTVEEGQGDKVATVQNVADAINSAKWIASVEETGEAITTSTENDTGVAIGAGDELSFKAGKNLKIKRDGQEITYALANDINVTTVTATGNITVGTGDNATTINQGSITNLDDHLTAPTANSTSPVTNATSTTAPTLTDAEKKQAATVNDVLNAGWNLQANDNAVDAVTHGNTVNFVSTDGTVTITPTTDGSTSKLDFSVNATSIVTNAAGNVSANATTGKAVVGANGVANTTTGYANKVATVGDVANTINNTGWLTNVTDANGNVTTKVVTPGTQVNYVNGNGTTANVVANSTTGGLDVTFNVSQNKAATQNANGTVTIADTANGTSTFLNAQDTVNLINSASFNVTTAKVDSFVTNQEGKENKAVKAGETITYTAGKNIAIKQDGANFTFATEQNVTFTNANVTGTLAIGGDNNSPVVNISTGTGERNSNGTTTSPNTVNMGNAQLTNVSAGANVYGQVVDANGRPLTAVTTRDASGNAVTNYYAPDQFTASGALIDGATSSSPVTTSNVAKAVSGLADLASSNATNVMTVADAKNLGWVVSASDNDYADKVQNANQVNFKAEANTGVTVKGATNATTGVREIVVGNDYFKANATSGSTAANAAGSNSVAVGPNSVANTAGSVAIGNGANVTTSAPAGSVAIGQGATAGAVNTGAYRIDGSTDVAGAPNASTRVFSVGNASSPAQIQNVAAGVVSATSTDAVNGSQLHATNQAVINNARAIGNLNNKIDQVDKRGRKGTAIAGAIGMLPQPHISGKSMVSAATTNYRGEQAVAVGYSRLSDNGKHIIKLSGSSNVSGKKDAMVGASYGYQW